MIKRICIFSFIFILAFSNVSAFAMEFTVSPEMIGGLGDLGYGLFGGAEFDFDGTEYVIDNYDNLSDELKAQAANEQARKFVQAYCIARGIPIPNIGTDLPPTDLKNFYKSNYFSSSVRTTWNNYKLGSDVTAQEQALRFPLGPQAFSDWSEYNSFWYSKYANDFVPDDVIADPETPSEYQSYVDLINNVSPEGFFWANLTTANSTNGNYGRFTGTIGSDYSYRSLTDFTNLSQGGFVSSSGNYAAAFNVCSPFSVFISGSGSIYQVTSTTITPDYVIYSPYQGNYTSCYYMDYDSNSDIYYITVTGRPQDVTPLSFTGTLEECLTYVSFNCRNVGIYVNGLAWDLPLDPAPANPTIPTFPDVIGGNSEDPIPAYDIVFPNTSNYEGTFDITSIFDAIKEAIIGASDSDDSTSSSLTRDDVVTSLRDATGETVGEREKTIDAVLDDSFPIQATLNYPNIPMFDEPIHNAFQGTTVLAQLIDATQKSLPESLILCMWGIIFILFIIGLVKILHK